MLVHQPNYTCLAWNPEYRALVAPSEHFLERHDFINKCLGHSFNGVFLPWKYKSMYEKVFRMSTFLNCELFVMTVQFEHDKGLRAVAMQGTWVA